MHDFAYHRPSDLAEATSLLREAADPKLLAGGMTLLPALKKAKLFQQVQRARKA